MTNSPSSTMSINKPMDLFTRDDLRDLAKKQEGLCVSIYMPTHRASKEIKQDRIKFKNLLRKAEDALLGLGLRKTELDKFIEPARKLIPDDNFWLYQSDGLALFLSAEMFRTYRLPVTFNDLVVVTNRFDVKPLVSFLSGSEERFYVLALSKKSARLFHCTPFTVNEVEVEGLPTSIAEALKYEAPAKELQLRTLPRAASNSGRGPAIFHGQGSGIEDEKDMILQYCIKVDRALKLVLHDETAPLVFAGVDSLFSIYREANSFRHLADDAINGNPELVKPEELQKEAWSIVQPYFEKNEKDAADRFRQSLGTGLASTDYKQIIPAARNGRIDTLFVAVGVQLWGILDSNSSDPNGNGLVIHETEQPGDEDLLDYAAVQAILHGGTVYPIRIEEMPDGVTLGALFRY